jgi:hypothetical protein
MVPERAENRTGEQEPATEPHRPGESPGVGLFDGIRGRATADRRARGMVPPNAYPKEVGDQAKLPSRQLGSRSRGGVREESLRPSMPGGSEPTTDGSLSDTEGNRDIALLPPALFEVERTHSSPFPPVLGLRVRVAHALL